MPRWQWENKITLGNLIQIVIIILGGLSAWMGALDRIGTVESRVEAAATANRVTDAKVTAIDNSLDPLPKLEVRVDNLETRISQDATRSAQFEQEVRQTLKEQNATQIKVLEQQAAVLEAVKALSGKSI